MSNFTRATNFTYVRFVKNVSKFGWNLLKFPTLAFSLLTFIAFTTKNSRDRHQERHTTNDHRPYQCRLCFNTFKRSKYHNRHIKKFHPDEPELPAIRLPLRVTGLAGKNDGDAGMLDEDGVIVKTEGDNQ
jgi:hypothetical protein